MNPYMTYPKDMAGINHSYAPESGDFKVEAKHINSQSEGSLQYWASVLDHCDASVRIYKAPKGGRDVFALGRILVKSSHLHKTEDGQPTEVERDYSYADANEVQAIAIARRALRKELNHVRVPKINFAGKIDGRQVLVQERVPGESLNVACWKIDDGQLRVFKQQARDILRALRDVTTRDGRIVRARDYVVRDPNILTNGRIQPLEADILFSKDNDDPDMGFMHNDFTMANCIVKNDKIVGLINWEMAGFFGWKAAGQVHHRIRSPQRESFADSPISESMLSGPGFLGWNDLYDYEH
ncbi:hypothetical protein F4820DRAFT_452550 [Hypoxylon rubiginosum]|uniref:Uncharacterized protein n=1 Tax=Hypoxylon rubiginosum TaxID=110542 RepID=A0ACB9YNP9_9PEZI|nr:hypothetical protein F4820DRAFT_452550 [Hypoxylon rubiginosum]